MTGRSGVSVSPVRDPRRDLVPPGWPAAVLPPQAPDWERSAIGWLFDLCPADYRAHEVLRRHPVVLARFAAGHVESAVEAARRGIRTARADLSGLVPVDVVEAALAAYDREGRRLVLIGREIALVDAALRGERHVPRL